MQSSKDSVIKFFDKSNQLRIANAEYKETINTLFSWLLQNDHVTDDTTTKLLFTNESFKETRARIISRGEVTVAGIEEITYLLDTFTKLTYKVVQKDGTVVKKNDVILELYGKADEILTYERTILNIMQRLSGIATTTKKNVSLIQSLKLSKSPQVAATRKTIWGTLDKKAVAVGGGLTHRLTLSDGILVKDNHLLLLEKQFNLKNEKDAVTKTLDLILSQVTDTLIEIEVEKRESIPGVIESFLASQKGNVLGILLDNFTPDTAKQTITGLQKYDLNNVVFEASGGITSDNLSSWATTGVDVISLGALTHSVKAADVSLEIVI